MGVSTCLDLAFPLARSIKLRLTSAGIEIGVSPIREGRDEDVEKALFDGSCANAGARKLETSLVCCASRRRHRKGCRNPVQDMVEQVIFLRTERYR